MSTPQQLSPYPMDSHQWRESALSMRSLSYVSQAGSITSPGIGSRQPSVSYIRAPTRRGSEHSDDDFDGDGDLIMADIKREMKAGLKDTPELPESVAQSLLFELPREIRDRIYSLCLAAKDGLPVEWPLPRDSPVAHDMQPQLLSVCRIIHDEAAPLLYTQNNMTFHHPSDANMFVHAFASSPMYGRHITNLSLHVKAQDMRMWMPYLTSTDEVRSLRADFPHLKEIGVRFRSNKWQHAHPPEANLKNCCDDSRLEEVIDGLRHVFSPPETQSENSQKSEREFQEFMARNPTALQNPTLHSGLRFYRRLLQLKEVNGDYHLQPRADAPNILVCCACRVPTSHFDVITSHPLPEGSQIEDPVQEGDPYRGFTLVDLKNGVRRLIEPGVGSAKVARTPYVVKNGIKLALEIHTLDSKRGGGGGGFLDQIRTGDV